MQKASKSIITEQKEADRPEASFGSVELYTRYIITSKFRRTFPGTVKMTEAVLLSLLQFRAESNLKSRQAKKL